MPEERAPTAWQTAGVVFAGFAVVAGLAGSAAPFPVVCAGAAVACLAVDVRARGEEECHHSQA